MLRPSSEFIRNDGQPLLIDFNPRFYHPLAFDIARGMSLPLMVYAAARGDEPWLRKLVEESARPGEGGQTTFCNGFGLHLLLAVQGASGRMSSGGRHPRSFFHSIVMNR